MRVHYRWQHNNATKEYFKNLIEVCKIIFWFKICICEFIIDDNIIMRQNNIFKNIIEVCKTLFWFKICICVSIIDGNIIMRQKNLFTNLIEICKIIFWSKICICEFIINDIITIYFSGSLYICIYRYIDIDIQILIIRSKVDHLLVKWKNSY